MSSYRGNDVFGSGPHRFTLGRRGQAVLPVESLTQVPSIYAFVVVGNFDERVFVAGRLVSASEASLWSLRQALIGETDVSNSPATLVNSDGRSYLNMRMVMYEETGPVGRGRAWSVAYLAEFRRFEAG